MYFPTVTEKTSTTCRSPDWVTRGGFFFISSSCLAGGGNAATRVAMARSAVAIRSRLGRRVLASMPAMSRRSSAHKSRGEAIFFMAPSPDHQKNCPICQRTGIPEWTDHHLLPKSEGGTETIALCRDCHSSIHRFFSNKKLRDYYHTIDRLLRHKAFAKHIKWLQKRDPNKRYKTKLTRDRRSKKRSRCSCTPRVAGLGT
jgi:hypothetical protein